MKTSLIPACLLVTLVVVACSGANPQDVYITTPTPNPSPTDASVPPDANVDASNDTGVDAEDASVSPDADACVPESDDQLCARTASTCSYVNATDNCGTTRLFVKCGQPCGKGATCTDGKCVACVSKTCAGLNFTCGDTSDGCNPVPLNCGTCLDAKNICVANVCVPKPPVCVPNTDLSVCTDAGYQCGVLDTIDNCGLPRHVPDCGGIPGHKLCDYLCLIDHTCCSPRAPAQLCANAGRVCGGPLTVKDCEKDVVIASCGPCAGAAMCSVDGKCVVPGP